MSELEEELRGSDGSAVRDDDDEEEEEEEEEDGAWARGGGGVGEGEEDEKDEHLPSFGREDVSEAILAELGDDEDELEVFEISLPRDSSRRGGGGQRRCPWRQLFFALFLIGVGLVCVCTAFYTLSVGHGATTALFVIGAIALLPGGWVTYSIVQAYRRVPGYSFDNLPAYQ